MTSPCYKCENRHEHWHAGCEQYAEWDARQKKARAQKNKYNDSKDFLIESIIKTKRRKT